MEAFPQRRKQAVMDSSDESSSYASSSEPSSESSSSAPSSAAHCSSGSSPSSASSDEWTSASTDNDNPSGTQTSPESDKPSTGESYRFEKGENVWGLDPAGGVSLWRWCKLLEGSNPQNFATSSSYLVGILGPAKRSFWVSRRFVLHYSKSNRGYIKKFNDGANKRKKFTGQGTAAPAQVTTSRVGQKSQPPVKKVMSSLQKPQENLEVKSTPMRKSNKENTPFTKPERIKKPKKRWFPFVPVKDNVSTNSAQVSVSHFSARDTQLSLMHEQSIITLMFVSGLRKSSTATYGLDDDNVTLRQSLLTFSYRPGNMFNANVPEAFLIISICKKPSVLPVVEYHPKCLRMFLNDRMVHTRIPDGQAPYPVVPLEIPLSALQTVNELLISWTESTAEDLSMDYCVHVYLAKRKQLSSIIAGTKTNVLSVAKSLMQERTRDGTDQDILAGTRTLNLNCPISKKRITLPVRGVQCRHLECFDAFSYLSINVGATARFLCPLCAQIVLPRDILVDEFFVEILSFTSEERIELIQDRTGITVQEYVKETVVMNFTKGPAGVITIDDNNDGRVICID